MRCVGVCQTSQTHSDPFADHQSPLQRKQRLNVEPNNFGACLGRQSEVLPQAYEWSTTQGILLHPRPSAEKLVNPCRALQKLSGVDDIMIDSPLSSRIVELEAEETMDQEIGNLEAELREMQVRSISNASREAFADGRLSTEQARGQGGQLQAFGGAYGAA